MREPVARFTEPRAGAASPAPDHDGRINLELRVAVTGHLGTYENDSEVFEAVEAALLELRRRCTNKATDSTDVGLTIVTSLAEGADRLVARVGLKLGARLEVVLPLPPNDYRSDFAASGSQDAFDELISRASSVVLGAVSRTRPDACAATGRAILARSDALLAVSDGRPARGADRTAEVVAEAREHNVPVCCLRVTRGAEDTSDLTVETEEMPDAVSPLSGDAFGKLDWFNRRPTPRLRSPSENGFPSTGAFARYALASFNRADYVAGRMQRLFRTVNRVLYSLAVVAVAVVAAQVIFARTHPKIVWGEFAALAVILIALVGARRARLLERWLSLRYLAERIRSLAYIAELTGQATLYIGELDAPVENPMDAWIRRALDELWLHARPSPIDDSDFVRFKTRLVEEWVRPQLTYQKNANRVARHRHKLFSYTTIALFGLSLVAAFLHSTGWLDNESRPDYLGFVSLVVPSAAAALSGYAAQRDYARQAIRSAAMQNRLDAGEARLIQASDLAELQQVAISVELVLQGEAADWYTAVRLHEPEVP